MKKMIAMMFAAACSLTMLAAQDAAPQENDSARGNRQRGERGMNRQGGERGMNRQGGGMGNMGGGMGNMGGGMGNMGGGMVMMTSMNDARTNAEAELQKKAPEEYSALVKEREAVEAKFKALAAKHEVTLPMTMEERRAKMDAFNKKYEKELAAIREQMKTEPREAMEKMQALMKAEGVDMIMPRMNMNRRNSDGAAPAPEAANPQRENRMREMRENIKKAYPEEFEKVEAIRRDNPEEYRKQFRALTEKYQAANKDKAPAPAPAVAPAE